MNIQTLAQPKALYLLNFVSMWECFSYYGMRVLLVLFMVHELNYSDEAAFGLYALYTTLVEFGGVIGGMIADRLLGFKRSIALGGITIALGHVSMALPDSAPTFFLGLGLIIAGTALFRSNVAAFLGQFYDENDPRRDAGYTLYYTGINVGGLLASLACGYVGEVYGWHAGFGLAALGMMSGNIALFFGNKILKTNENGKPPSNAATMKGTLGLALAAPICALAVYYNTLVSSIIPFVIFGVVVYLYLQMRNATDVVKKGIFRLVLLIVFLVIFYGCEEQLGSTLILFAERHVDRETAFGIIPAAALVTFNPLTILIAGPLFSQLIRKIPLEAMTKIGISFLLLGAAFCSLYYGSILAVDQEQVSLGIAIVSIVLISLGELFIGPTVYAAASEAAPPRLQGLIMGIVTLGYAFANMFSGYLSQMMSVVEGENSLGIYSDGFYAIACGVIALALIILITNYQRKGCVQT